MRLHQWSRAWRDVEFDSATGSARVIRLPTARPDTSPVSGFVAFERFLCGVPTAFALYRQADAVFFSAGCRAWRLGQSDLSFSHTRPFPLFSRFQVLEGSRVAFSFTYSHVGRLLWELLDPTYDKLDEDSDFFLSFVAEQAASPSWLQDVKEHWVPVPSREHQEPY